MQTDANLFAESKRAAHFQRSQHGMLKDSGKWARRCKRRLRRRRRNARRKYSEY